MCVWKNNFRYLTAPSCLMLRWGSMHGPGASPQAECSSPPPFCPIHQAQCRFADVISQLVINNSTATCLADNLPFHSHYTSTIFSCEPSFTWKQCMDGYGRKAIKVISWAIQQFTICLLHFQHHLKTNLPILNTAWWLYILWENHFKGKGFWSYALTKHLKK